MTDRPDHTMSLESQLEYDRDDGTVTITDGAIRQMIEVRTKLVDGYLRQAVIIELERLGYTVISPETHP